MAATCEKAGLAFDVLEPAGKIKINASDGNERMAETVTLRPDADGVLMWWWSWERPICPAEQIDRAIELISRVVTVRLF
ncbi:hypothetical protein GCM10027176_72870 [Actinoallomurus bryophytorum]|uniref:Uncharacterized protein n=2 Tax=Actinoallomurus bryophytorum TaxID=1490222 RepID=A0A543CVJ9_9ACTN|nr:hypothetical protein FB559_6872 [Actinoallomurus bryophytorum]